MQHFLITFFGRFPGSTQWRSVNKGMLACNRFRAPSVAKIGQIAATVYERGIAIYSNTLL